MNVPARQARDMRGMSVHHDDTALDAGPSQRGSAMEIADPLQSLRHLAPNMTDRTSPRLYPCPITKILLLSAIPPFCPGRSLPGRTVFTVL